MYYVYIVRCSDGSLYCGQTINLKRRVKEHNSSNKKSAKYMRAKRPVSLVYFEKQPSLSAALKREFEIKKLKKSDKESMIKVNFNTEPSI